MKVNRLIIILLCIVCIAVSGILKSRAFCLGFLVSLWSFIFILYPNHKRRVLLAGLFLILCATSLAYQWKLSSSLGRVFIYKISFAILRDHYISGIGFGAFKRVYMDYQAAYFAKGHFSVRELLLADNTFYAFNDYLQIIIEGGIMGAVIVLGYLFVLIRFLISSFHSNDLIIYRAAFLLYLAISVAAFFTHIYDRPIFQVLAAISISILLYHTFPAFLKRNFRLYVPGSVLIILLIVLVNFIGRVVHYRAYNEYAEGIHLNEAGFKKEALDKLKRIYPELQNNSEYLAYYGQQLLNNGQTTEAVRILDQALKIITFNDLYNELGQCYYLSGEYAKAEAAYITAINMVPNRFVSRYDLYKFYRQTGQPDKAVIVGRAILNLPVKISSSMITYIKSIISKDLAVSIILEKN